MEITARAEICDVTKSDVTNISKSFVPVLAQAAEELDFAMNETLETITGVPMSH